MQQQVEEERVTTGPSGTTGRQKEFLSQRCNEGDNPLPQMFLPPQDTNVLPPPSVDPRRHRHVPRSLSALLRYMLPSGALGVSRVRCGNRGWQDFSGAGELRNGWRVCSMARKATSLLSPWWACQREARPTSPTSSRSASTTSH